MSAPLPDTERAPENGTDAAMGTERTRAWSSDWGNLLLPGLILYMAIYLLWLAFDWNGDRTTAIVRELGILPVMALGVVYAIRTVRSPKLDATSRRAWRIIALAFPFWFLGDAFWSYTVIAGRGDPFPSFVDLFYFASYALLITGILSFPVQRLTRSEQFQFWLDTGIIFIGASVLIGMVVFGSWGADTGANQPSAPLLLVYSVIGVLSLVAVSRILAHQPESGSAGVFILLGAGMLVVAGANILWAFLEARDQYAYDDLTYMIWMIGQVLLVISPQWHYDVVNRRPPNTRVGYYARRLRTAIPYTAAAIALVVVVAAGLPILVDQLFGLLVVLIVVLLGMAIARQLITLRHNTRLQIEHATRQSEQHFQALVEFSSDMITVVDRDLTCRFQSLSSRDILGYLPDEIVGSHVMDWIDPSHQDTVRNAINSILNGERRAVKLEWPTTTSEGRVVHLETIISDELSNPLIHGLVLNARDVTARKQLEARLRHLASHDPLTGLPNRSLISEKLARARNDETTEGVALVFIDLDHFKLVNDTLGHDAGDELLVNAAERLGDAIRPGDILGRLGGDEFIALLDNVANLEDAVDVANRLLEALKPPMVIAGQITQLSASVGVVHTRSPDEDAETLLTRADSAMYAAKRSGRGRVEIYLPGMDNEVHQFDRDRAPLDLRAN